MPASSLLIPDSVAWQDEAHYSAEAAAALIHAYARIASAGDRSATYLWACADLASWLDRPMSERQRMHVFFVFAMGHAADGAITSALFWLDRALDLAMHLEEVADCLELLVLRSSFHRAISKCEDATTDLRQCLAIARAWEEAGALPDLPFRFQVLTELARFEFFTGRFRRSEYYLHQAQHLIPALPEKCELEAASLTWVQAHLDRTRGLLDRALLPALAVADVYAREAPLVSQDRIHVFVAATALDVAATFEAGSPAGSRTPFLSLARSHLARAEQLAREAHDQPGKVLIQVMRTRYSRLSGRTADRVTALEKVIRTAQHLDDEALLAEGLTALGDEFAACGEQESALSCYRQVLQALDGRQIPTLGVPAHRALLRIQESTV